MINDILIDRAVQSYHRAGGRRLVRAAYSRVLSSERPDGSQRLYVCLSDQAGIMAIYRVRKGGRLVRMLRWPLWLREFDRDPGWRSYCRETERIRLKNEQQQGGYQYRIIERPIVPVTIKPSVAPVAIKSTIFPQSAMSFYDIDPDDLATTLEELDRLPARLVSPQYAH